MRKSHKESSTFFIFLDNQQLSCKSDDNKSRKIKERLMSDHKHGQHLIDGKTALDQMDKFNLRYGSIEDYLVKNDGLIDLIAEKHIQCIDNHKEDLYIRCGNRIWQPFTLLKNTDTTKFVYNPKEIEQKCQGDPPSVIHFHGVYPGYPSDADRYAHQEVFKGGFTEGAVVGIDGIHVQTPYGHLIRIPWSKEMDKKLAEHGKRLINNVRTITCNKMEKDSNLRECTIHFANGGTFHQIFSKVIWEEPSLDQSFYPYRSLDAKNRDRTSHVEFRDRETTCVITNRKKDRILTCFHRDITV